MRNDPETYDYLTHYYLLRARLNVRYHRRQLMPYLDSLAWATAHTTNIFDRVYYGHHLADLYAAAGRYPAAYAARTRATQLADSLGAGGEVAEVRQRLLRSEEEAAARQRQYAAVRQQARTWGLWGLSAALAIITLLSFYLYRQARTSRRQARALARANAALAETNGQLDGQVAQVELLNKEIQHRVKNNLHMVYSLLHMQERRTDNEEVIEHLQAARLRVESIAALQNQLLRNPDVPDLTAFLRHLVSVVVSCLADDQRVMTHLAIEPVQLSVNSYFALSLILNECITNSVKYAQVPPRQALEVNVTVKPRPDGICVEYYDNGCPPEAPPPAAGPDGSGLGTQIISLLSQQLRATLSHPPGVPYHYQLLIPPGA